MTQIFYPSPAGEALVGGSTGFRLVYTRRLGINPKNCGLTFNKRNPLRVDVHEKCGLFGGCAWAKGFEGLIVCVWWGNLPGGWAFFVGAQLGCLFLLTTWSWQGLRFISTVIQRNFARIRRNKQVNLRFELIHSAKTCACALSKSRWVELYKYTKKSATNFSIRLVRNPKKTLGTGDIHLMANYYSDCFSIGN